MRTHTLALLFAARDAHHAAVAERLTRRQPLFDREIDGWHEAPCPLCGGRGGYWHEPADPTRAAFWADCECAS